MSKIIKNRKILSLFSIAIVILIIVSGYFYWLVSTDKLSSSADINNFMWITTKVTGHIHSDSGEHLIAQITITAQAGDYVAASGQSNSDGNFSITFQHPPQYIYDITVSKIGYSSYVDRDVKLNIPLKKYPLITLYNSSKANGKIYGYVTVKTATTPVPAKEAWITVTKIKGDIFNTTTDSQGYYEVNKLIIGAYQVCVDPDPYQLGDDVCKSITLGPAEAKRVDFVLDHYWK